jgi:hypothetical protein
MHRLKTGSYSCAAPKGTWIRGNLGDAYVVNLLAADSMLRYERDPAHFRAEVLARPTSQWIVVDEVQRVPRIPGLLASERKRGRLLALRGSVPRR